MPQSHFQANGPAHGMAPQEIGSHGDPLQTLLNPIGIILNVFTACSGCPAMAWKFQGQDIEMAVQKPQLGQKDLGTSAGYPLAEETRRSSGLVDPMRPR